MLIQLIPCTLLPPWLVPQWLAAPVLIFVLDRSLMAIHDRHANVIVCVCFDGVLARWQHDLC